MQLATRVATVITTYSMYHVHTSRGSATQYLLLDICTQVAEYHKHYISLEAFIRSLPEA